MMLDELSDFVKISQLKLKHGLWFSILLVLTTGLFGQDESPDEIGADVTESSEISDTLLGDTNAISVLAGLEQYNKLPDSLRVNEKGESDKTCSELYGELKKSNCGRTIFKYLNGASVKVGASLNLSSIQIKSNDSLYGDMVGFLSPAPYYSLSLATQFISTWNVGYQFALAYTSTSAVNQRLERDGVKKVADLNTLSILGIAAVTPSIFYSVGGRDEDPKIYTNFGFGLGMGWAWVKGVIYHTEKNNAGNQTCYDTSTDYVAGTVSKVSITSECELKNFQQSSLGLSARLFLEGRWNFVYSAVEVVGITITSSRLNFHPTEAKIKLAYIIDM